MIPRVVEKGTRRKRIREGTVLVVLGINLDNLEIKDSVLPGRPRHCSTQAILLLRACRPPIIILVHGKARTRGKPLFCGVLLSRMTNVARYNFTLGIMLVHIVFCSVSMDFQSEVDVEVEKVEKGGAKGAKVEKTNSGSVILMIELVVFW